MRSAPIPASLIKSAKNAWRVCVHWWPRVHRREEKRPDKKIYVREIGRSRRRGHVRNIVIVIIIYTYIGDRSRNNLNICYKKKETLCFTRHLYINIYN